MSNIVNKFEEHILRTEYGSQTANINTIIRNLKYQHGIKQSANVDDLLHKICRDAWDKMK